MPHVESAYVVMGCVAEGVRSGNVTTTSVLLLVVATGAIVAAEGGTSRAVAVHVFDHAPTPTRLDAATRNVYA